MSRIVEFKNNDEEFKGFRVLSMASQTIKNIKDSKYVVTKEQCELLKSRNIKYNVLHSDD